MKLVRFGKRVINMAQIVEIEYQREVDWNSSRSDPAGYKLYTNQIVDGLPNYIWIDGADMIALEMWLADNSDNARAPMENEP